MVVELLRSRRGTVAGASALLVAHQICEAAVPLLVGVIVDEAIGPADTTALALGLAGLALLFVFLSYAYRNGARIGEAAELAAGHELRLRVSRRVLDPRGGAEAGRLSGDLTAVAADDATRVGGLVSLIGYALAALGGALAGAVFLLARAPELGLLVLAGLPLLLLAVELLGRPLTRRADRDRAAAAEAGAVAADLIAGLRPLKGIGGEAAAEARYREASERARGASVRAARAQAAFEGAITLFSGLLLVAVALLGGRLAAEGELSLGALIAALGLTQFLVGPLSQFGWIGSELSRVRASAGRVAAVLDAPVAIAGGDRALAPAPAGALALRGVSAGPLAGVEVVVAPGELLAIASVDPAEGERLVDLLAREADPEQGSVQLDGMPLTAFEPRALRAALLVAEHDATLFEGTLREVVTAAGADGAGLETALATAAADEVAGSVPGGLEGAVSARGRSLSGGQRQRLALARALFADPPVLVLHEPTTAVDAASEAGIAIRLRELRRGRTTVVVTTSPALLGVADRVVFVADGAVAAEGSHRRLLAEHPRYRELVLS